MTYPRDSFRATAWRSFLKSFFFSLGIIVIFMLFAVFSAFLQPPLIQENKTQISSLPDLNGNDDFAGVHAPVILQIPIHGVIGDPEGVNTAHLQAILMDSRKGLLAGNRVKGILLYFNTPGGTVVDSDNIYRMLLRYKQIYGVPVYGYVDGLCASGGMYIASAADRMYCGFSGIVGSVGVVLGPFVNISETISKIGMHAVTLAEGIGKDNFNPLRPWDPNEGAVLQQVMHHFYNQFVKVVTEGRKQINRDRLVNEYGAKIFDGPTAQDYGYVDVANSSYEDALEALLLAAQIDPQQPYQVVELKKQRSVMDVLLGKSWMGYSGRMEHKILLNGDTPAFLKNHFAYLFQPTGN